MVNPTNNKYTIHSNVEQRWSPRAFSSELVEKEKLQSILEAARWAPSASNEQPWRFIIGKNDDATYEKILSTLVDWNQMWAGKAPILILNIAKKSFSHNNKPNVTFKYDLGQSVGLMITEIVNQGLVSHQMSGFDAVKASELFNIPDDYQPVSVTAIGYIGDVSDLPKDIAEMETKPRERNEFSSMVFTNEFGSSYEL